MSQMGQTRSFGDVGLDVRFARKRTRLPDLSLVLHRPPTHSFIDQALGLEGHADIYQVGLALGPDASLARPLIPLLRAQTPCVMQDSEHGLLIAG
jgi:hypothetical protein